MDVSEMDVAELECLLDDISRRFRTLHGACPVDALEREALWTAAHRASLAADSAKEAWMEAR